MDRKRLLYGMFVVMAVVLLAGCGRQQTPAPAPEPMRPQMQMQDDRRLMMQADDAALIAEQHDEVDRAYAVMSGPDMVLVGIDLDDDVSDDEARRIEEALAEEIPNRLQGVERAVVTSDPDFFERIRRIGEGVAEGRPLSEFADETQEMIDRLSPRARMED